VPNLVVAKPWLTELLRPLQRSLHQIADSAGQGREADETGRPATGADAAAGGRESQSRGSRSPARNSRGESRGHESRGHESRGHESRGQGSRGGSRTNTPSPPRHACGLGRTSDRMSSGELLSAAEAEADGGLDVGMAAVGGDERGGTYEGTLGVGSTAALGTTTRPSPPPTGTPSRLSVACLGEGLSPFGSTAPGALRFPARAVTAVSTDWRAHERGRSSPPRSRPLQQAILGKPPPAPPVSKLGLPKNAFLPGGARAPLGDAHFAHASSCGTWPRVKPTR